jgi:hypothetical protein
LRTKVLVDQIDRLLAKKVHQPALLQLVQSIRLMQGQKLMDDAL